MLHLVWKLLDGDTTIRELLAVDPFDGKPPKWVRIRRFVLSPRALQRADLVDTGAGRSELATTDFKRHTRLQGRARTLSLAVAE